MPSQGVAPAVAAVVVEVAPPVAVAVPGVAGVAAAVVVVVAAAVAPVPALLDAVAVVAPVAAVAEAAAVPVDPVAHENTFFFALFHTKECRTNAARLAWRTRFRCAEAAADRALFLIG